MRSPSAQLTAQARAERERLAGLSPEQWDTPSLCEGWRVREVVAHVTMPFRTRPAGVLAGLLRAGFSVDRYADLDARSTARGTGPAGLVAVTGRHSLSKLPAARQ